MDKISKTELLELSKDVTETEIYRFKFNPGRIHTDNLESAYEYYTIEDLPFDENEEIECYVEIMDADEYDHTVLANSCIYTSDYLTDDEREVYSVLLIILPVIFPNG